MRDNIRLALSKKNMTGEEISDYIRTCIDTEARIITVYLTVRIMHKEGLIVRLGDKYQLSTKTGKLLSSDSHNKEEPEKVNKKKKVIKK